jgi:hypothetical protein
MLRCFAGRPFHASMNAFHQIIDTRSPGRGPFRLMLANNLAQYHAPDLVLVPPDMPHTWASTATLEQAQPHTAIVIWSARNWALQLAELCLEYSALRRLLQNASTGLAFTPEIAADVEKQLPHLLSDLPQVRLHAALNLLVKIAGERATNLSRTATTIPASNDGEPAQLTRVLIIFTNAFRILFPSTDCAR